MDSEAADLVRLRDLNKVNEDGGASNGGLGGSGAAEEYPKYISTVSGSEEDDLRHKLDERVEDFVERDGRRRAGVLESFHVVAVRVFISAFGEGNFLVCPVRLIFHQGTIDLVKA